MKEFKIIAERTMISRHQFKLLISELSPELSLSVVKKKTDVVVEFESPILSV